MGKSYSFGFLRKFLTVLKMRKMGHLDPKSLFLNISLNLFIIFFWLCLCTWLKALKSGLKWLFCISQENSHNTQNGEFKLKMSFFELLSKFVYQVFLKLHHMTGVKKWEKWLLDFEGKFILCKKCGKRSSLIEGKKTVAHESSYMKLLD